MRREHSPRFDALEARKLLSTAHVAVVKPLTPVDLGGTLTVNVNASSQYENPDASWTTTVPVSGELGTLGKVKGSWETSIDQFGNYQGPDELILQSSKPKGAFVIDFNNQNAAKPTKISPGLGFYQHGQHFTSGSGVYAHDSEAGSIELMDNLKKGSVTSLVLITVPPTSPAAT